MNREFGAGNEDRTRDLKITNLALYQLSYPGAELHYKRRTYNRLMANPINDAPVSMALIDRLSVDN